MSEVTVSSAARRRIRSFSVWVWVWGSLVLFIGALTTFSDIGLGDDGFGLLSETGDPWEMADPPVIEPDGTIYSGEGSGVIRIPLEEHNQSPYRVTLTSDGYLDLYVTGPEDIALPQAERGTPDNVAYLYSSGDEALVLPVDTDLELWVRGAGAWEFTMQKAEVTEITDGFASGSSTDFLVYRGDAVSARFIHKGSGIFFVTIQTLGGMSDRPIIDSGEIDERVSWDPTDAVYISIEADDGRGAWSIDIDELATVTPTEPDPTTGSPAPAALAPTESTQR